MINWDQQWKDHCPYYKDGIAVIPCSQDKKMFLYPGAGFGDLSHPTTQLIFSQIADNVKDKTVVDMGAGSGILSIASRLLGAKKIYSFETNLDAIDHFQKNIYLNQVDQIMINRVPQNFDVVLMNMIFPEQQIALQHHPFLFRKGDKCIISGILQSQKEEYLEFLAAYQKNCYFIQEKNGWLLLFIN